MLRIKVGATSANLCVGFDVLGLALDLYNKFGFEPSDDFKFKGFKEEYLSIKNNMVYDAYTHVFKLLNKKPIPVEISFSGNIPVSRGLGSSSSLIVAGVFAANYFLGNPFDKDKLFDICANIEGHPDNVAPAVYGGLVASYKSNGSFKPNFYNVSDKLKFMAIIPPFKISTHDAREVLPKELPYKDIVNNLSRIVNLPKAFNDGNVELLKELFEDKLHEPYRGKLIKGYEDIKKICNDNGYAFAISGSGSTMLVIGYDYNIMDKLSSFGYELVKLNPGQGVSLWVE
jgi:homoserine kinase